METTPAASINMREQFQQAGFDVVDASKSPEAITVKKYNCKRLLERLPNGTWAPSGPPYFHVQGLDCELEDRGYQKFWYADGKRFPIRKMDLETLHRFDQEVHSILRLKSLYNESLGSTCARTAYDRLNGRPE